MAQGRTTRALHQWWPFALLCLALAFEWMITNSYPQSGSTLTSEAAGCALAAFGFAWFPRKGSRASWLAFAAGALLLGGPLAGLLLHATMLGPSSLATALALTPVVIAVAEGSGDHRRLWPGIAAVAGLLLVLPLPSFASPAADAALVLAPLATGLGCVLFRKALNRANGRSTAWVLPAALAGGALVFAAAAGFHAVVERARPTVAPAAIALDALLATLAILALSRLSALRYAARFVLVPLVLFLQGFVYLRTLPTWRNIACVLLLCAATWALLRDNNAEPEV